MKNVLIIAYNFPPHGGAGVQRTTKFVKYLPEFGWQPIVICASADAGEVQDASLLNDFNTTVPVYRVRAFSIERARKKLSRFRLGRLLTIVNILLLLPDSRIFWARAAYKEARAIVRKMRPEIIYTTSGPNSSHLVGRRLCRECGIPWFADFRDPWSNNLLAPYLPGYRRLNRYMERQVLEAADRVGCVSEPWLRGLKENCVACPESKLLVLENGYDEEDIAPLPMPATNRRFVLTYIGSFYRTRRPVKFINAVNETLQTNQLQSSQICVRFVGKNVRRAVPDGLPYEVIDYVPHKELVKLRAETDALLLLLNTASRNAGTPSGKIYEYIASNRPILAIVPKGGVAQELIEKTRTGIAVGGDVDEIASAIMQLYEQWKAGFPDWNPNWDVIRQYTRRNLTRRLAAEFDEMVAEAG